MAKIALLIGVSEYEPGLDALPSAVNDVAAMQQVLANPGMGDFADAAVTVLRNPSRQVMEDAIYTLFAFALRTYKRRRWSCSTSFRDLRS